MPRETVLVSACLLGVECRYDAKAKPRDQALELLRRFACVPVCPEQLGGLATPRPKSRLKDGDGRAVFAGQARLIRADGCDVTHAFVKGADEAVRLAKLFGATQAYLKQRSPSCGYGTVKVDSCTTEGVGVAAAALEANGVEIIPID